MQEMLDCPLRVPVLQLLLKSARAECTYQQARSYAEAKGGREEAPERFKQKQNL